MKAIKILFAAMFVALLTASPADAQKLVIVSANDTHSQIDPTPDGKGGIVRRKALYDQIRRDNENTLFVHCGDAVQGTVYFNLYKGKVEYALIDSLGYDLITLGNHEFDNAVDGFADMYANIKAEKLSANYDVSASLLDRQFRPYSIKAYGDKRVGIFAVNVNPKGMISEGNYDGIRYLDAMDVADATAKYLKEVQKVDFVVMISHIGYDSMDPSEPNDSLIVANSHYIDLVIGGHSHSVIKPGSKYANVHNADGKVVIIGQNGKSGKLVGRFDIDLATRDVQYSHIAVDSTLDEAAKKEVALIKWLEPYRHGVDSLMNNPVGLSARAWKNHSQASQNWVCDATMEIVKKVSGIKDLDCAIVNKGGIRVDMPKGVVTEGVINSMFPFNNRYVVLEIKGSDLMDALHTLANRGGDAVSKELSVTFNDKAQITSAKIRGKKIKPEKIYKVATIDYLANGGDYMVAFTRANKLWVDDVKYGIHMLQYVKDLKAQGKMIDSTDDVRMKQK